MTTSTSVSRAPRPSSLADVLDLILDKGLVIDAYIRVSALGIEVLTIDARIVIASVDTYLHYAEAVNRLDLTQTETQGLTGMFGSDSGNGSGNGEGDEDEGDDQEEAKALPGRRSQGGQGQRSRARRESSEQGGGSKGSGKSLASRLGDRGKWSE